MTKAVKTGRRSEREGNAAVGRNSKAGNTVSLTANRKYKDTVFRMLFSDKERLLELYNAVSGRHYVNSDELQIVTLENAVYMGMKNDMAFLLDTGIQVFICMSISRQLIPICR